MGVTWRAAATQPAPDLPAPCQSKQWPAEYILPPTLSPPAATHGKPGKPERGRRGGDRMRHSPRLLMATARHVSPRVMHVDQACYRACQRNKAPCAVYAPAKLPPPAVARETREQSSDGGAAPADGDAASGRRSASAKPAAPHAKAPPHSVATLLFCTKRCSSLGSVQATNSSS